MRLALYQPDIPQNTGTIIRMAACLALPVDLIGPVGFDTTDKAFRRAGMDYLEIADVSRHISFAAFLATLGSTHVGTALRSASEPRLVLLTTAGTIDLPAFQFQPRDVLLFGRESSGVPADVHDVADARLRIPIAKGRRSLNLAVASAIIVSAALTQLNRWPTGTETDQTPTD